MSTVRSLLHAFLGNNTEGVTESARPVVGRLLGSGGTERSGVALYVVPLAVDPSVAGVVQLEAMTDGGDNEPAGTQRPVHIARLQAFDGVDYDRLRSSGDNADAQAALALGVLATLARNSLWNGATWDRMRAASAAVQSAVAQTGIAAVAGVGNWSSTSDPAAGALASVSKAAGGAGVRHVCTSISASLSAAAAATATLKVYLRDGAAGAGPILWSRNIKAPANDSKQIEISGLSIVGSANTAMTLEFSAAPAAGEQENVSLTGYSVT